MPIHINVKHLQLPERTSVSVCLAEVTQYVPEPVSHKVQVTNHLQLSSAADQSELHSLLLFISLLALFLSIHLFCIPPYSSRLSFMSCLFSSRLSQ